MTKFDFSIQDTTPRSNDKEYVLLQAGKGKAKFSSLYVNPMGFSYIEGLIWNKFREFKRENKNKILSHEWDRILDGFHLAIELMKEKQDATTLKKTLKFHLTSPKYSLDTLLEEQESFIIMFTEIIDWLTKVVSQEKYIYVNYLN